MIATATLVAFTLAALVLLITPGPAIAFIVARSLEGGRRAGLVSQLGLCTGLLVHVAGAAFGLSAILARSATAFTAVKLAGAAYLLYLGVRTLSSSATLSAPGERRPRASSWRLFVDGFLVDVLNPKAALFFLVLLPQFVDPGIASPAQQMVALGLIFVVLAFVVGSLYAWLAGSVAARLHASSSFERRTRWASGSVYLGLGVLAAVWRR